MEGYVRISLDWKETTARLTAAQKGRLVDALVACARGDADWKSAFRGNERLALHLMAVQADGPEPIE